MDADLHEEIEHLKIKIEELTEQQNVLLGKIEENENQIELGQQLNSQLLENIIILQRLVDDKKKLSSIRVKRPKIIESRQVLEFNINGAVDNVLNFEYGPGHFNRKLHLKFTHSQGSYLHNLVAEITEESTQIGVQTALEPERHEYFVQMIFIKKDEPTGVQRSFQLTTPSGRALNNFNITATWDATANSISFPGAFLQSSDYASSHDSYTFKIMVILSIMEYEYDVTREASNSDHSHSYGMNHKRAKAILWNLKSQLGPKVNLAVAANQQFAMDQMTLRECGSPVFKAMFEPTLDSSYRPKSIDIQYVSKNSIIAFSNWVYGLDIKEGGLSEDLQLNLELLQFGAEYMICDLLQHCTDNITEILEKKFTINLLSDVWNFIETFKFPWLENCDFVKICTENTIQIIEKDFSIKLLNEVWTIGRKYNFPGLQDEQLIGVCTQFIIKLLTDQFTIELLNEVWMFGKTHAFPGLKDPVLVQVSCDKLIQVLYKSEDFLFDVLKFEKEYKIRGLRERALDAIKNAAKQQDSEDCLPLHTSKK